MDLTTPRITVGSQTALDTLTAYITVNVVIDAIDAGKRLKGSEMTAFKLKHVILSKHLAEFTPVWMKKN